MACLFSIFAWHLQRKSLTMLKAQAEKLMMERSIIFLHEHFQ